MIKIEDKSDCCGCYGCVNICPKKSITMKVDEEGFWYPKVNEELCIKCGLCEKVCPVINNLPQNTYERNTYVCQNNNDQVRECSSSGGIFDLLCEYVIKQNGVVFGAAFDENFEVVHSYSETMKDCNRYRGSKYVQSKIDDMYTQVKAFLLKGRIVLFSGTQCQIKGLKLFLGEDFDNLFTVDVICHGVPSPLVFRMYRKELEKRYNSNTEKIEFRNKSLGWKKFSYFVQFENSKKYCRDLNNDIYIKGFLRNLYLRQSCYKCKAKNFTSNSDISLGDYWGVEELHNAFRDDKGTSLIIINSNKGNELFKSIEEKLKFEKTNLEYAIKNNHCIVGPVRFNNNRTRFFKLIKKKDLEYSITKCLKDKMLSRVKAKIKRIIR